MERNKELEKFFDVCVKLEANDGFLKQLQKYIDIYEGKEVKNGHGFRNKSR